MDGHSLEILTHESNSITLQPLKKRVTDISIQVDLSSIGDNKVAPWYALIKSRVECEQYLKYITIPSLLLSLIKLWMQYMSSAISENIVRNYLFQGTLPMLGWQF